MKKILLTLSIGFSLILNANSESYVDDSIKFININVTDEESHAWGVCAASLKLISEIIEKAAPAKSKQFSDYSNGAELAVTMSMVVSELTEDISPEKFERIWEFSKFLGDQIPQTIRTTLLADLESDKTEGSSVFLGNLGDTVAVCLDNLDGQQMYINVWRELYKSGLLKSPE
ncbi:hypothetical protein [Marinicellulosiphila megalodicopiae]|uniref:hypothetical protein n=1 Tax=Marinicellulosiphila megalodicopiae TaxID=2724896 RepID=UPI003BB1F673